MSMQYQGRATVAGTSIYVTGGDVNIARSPIIPDLVWGRGWKVNYAAGRQDASFNINFPVFSTYMAGLKTIGIASASRDNFFSSTISNGGIQVLFASGKCNTISFSADAMGNSPFTCALGVTALAGVASAASATPGSPTNTLGQTPIPSYAVTFVAPSIAPSNAVTAFNVEVNHNPYKLFTLSGDFIASDIQQGLYGVTGSFTYYSAAAGTAQGVLTSGSATIGGPSVSLAIASFLVTNDGNSITNPSEKPMRIVTFEAIGTNAAAPIT